MNLKCVRMVLQYRSRGNLEDIQEEAIDTFDFDESPGYAASEFGFFDIEPQWPENFLIYREEGFFDFDEIQPAIFQPYGWGQDPDYGGGWNIDKLVLKLQPYFEHQIDFTKYIYKIGFFAGTMEVNTPPKDKPFIRPAPILGIPPQSKPDDFATVVTWFSKKPYKKIGYEVVVAPLAPSEVASRLYLSSPERPYVLPEYFLEDFTDYSVEFYISSFIEMCLYFGVEVKHQPDYNKYTYSLRTATVQELYEMYDFIVDGIEKE